MPLPKILITDTTNINNDKNTSVENRKQELRVNVTPQIPGGAKTKQPPIEIEKEKEKKYLNPAQSNTSDIFSRIEKEESNAEEKYQRKENVLVPFLSRIESGIVLSNALLKDILSSLNNGIKILLDGLSKIEIGNANVRGMPISRTNRSGGGNGGVSDEDEEDNEIDVDFGKRKPKLRTKKPPLKTRRFMRGFGKTAALAAAGAGGYYWYSNLDEEEKENANATLTALGAVTAVGAGVNYVGRKLEKRRKLKKLKEINEKRIKSGLSPLTMNDDGDFEKEDINNEGKLSGLFDKRQQKTTQTSVGTTSQNQMDVDNITINANNVIINSNNVSTGDSGGDIDINIGRRRRNRGKSARNVTWKNQKPKTPEIKVVTPKTPEVKTETPKTPEQLSLGLDVTDPQQVLRNISNESSNQKQKRAPRQKKIEANTPEQLSLNLNSPELKLSLVESQKPIRKPGGNSALGNVLGFSSNFMNMPTTGNRVGDFLTGEAVEYGAEKAGGVLGNFGRRLIPRVATAGGARALSMIGGPVTMAIAEAINTAIENKDELLNTGQVAVLPQLEKMGKGLTDFMDLSNGFFSMKRAEGLLDALSGATGTSLGAGTQIGKTIHDKLLPESVSNAIGATIHTVATGAEGAYDYTKNLLGFSTPGAGNTTQTAATASSATALLNAIVPNILSSSLPLITSALGKTEFSEAIQKLPEKFVGVFDLLKDLPKTLEKLPEETSEKYEDLSEIIAKNANNIAGNYENLSKLLTDQTKDNTPKPLYLTDKTGTEIKLLDLLKENATDLLETGRQIITNPSQTIANATSGVGGAVAQLAASAMPVIGPAINSAISFARAGNNQNLKLNELMGSGSAYKLSNITSTGTRENVMSAEELQQWQTQTPAGVALGRTLSDMRNSNDPAIKAIADKIQLTSGNKGGHVRGSLHGKGLAFDYNRTTLSEDEQEIFAQWASKHGLRRDARDKSITDKSKLTKEGTERWHFSVKSEYLPEGYGRTTPATATAQQKGGTASSLETAQQTPGSLVPTTSYNRTQTALGINATDWQIYKQSVANIEGFSGEKGYNFRGGAGNKFMGLYQMGRVAINNAAQILGEKPPTDEEFLNNPDMQERYFDAFTYANSRELLKNEKYAGKNTFEKMKLLGYAHNQGARGTTNALNSGSMTGRDKFGTKATIYGEELQKQYNNFAQTGRLTTRSGKPASLASRVLQTAGNVLSATNLPSMMTTAAGAALTGEMPDLSENLVSKLFGLLTGTSAPAVEQKQGESNESFALKMLSSMLGISTAQASDMVPTGTTPPATPTRQATTTPQQPRTQTNIPLNLGEEIPVEITPGGKRPDFSEDITKLLDRAKKAGATVLPGLNAIPDLDTIKGGVEKIKEFKEQFDKIKKQYAELKESAKTIFEEKYKQAQEYFKEKYKQVEDHYSKFKVAGGVLSPEIARKVAGHAVSMPASLATMTLGGNAIPWLLGQRAPAPPSTAPQQSKPGEPSTLGEKMLDPLGGLKGYFDSSIDITKGITPRYGPQRENPIVDVSKLERNTDIRNALLNYKKPELEKTKEERLIDYEEWLAKRGYGPDYETKPEKTNKIPFEEKTPEDRIGDYNEWLAKRGYEPLDINSTPTQPGIVTTTPTTPTQPGIVTPQPPTPITTETKPERIITPEEKRKNIFTENKYYEGGNIAADIGSMAREALTGGDITGSVASMGAKTISGMANALGFGEGPFAGIGGELGNIATAAMTGGDILSASGGLIEKGVTGGLSVLGDLFGSKEKPTTTNEQQIINGGVSTSTDTTNIPDNIRQRASNAQQLEQQISSGNLPSNTTGVIPQTATPASTSAPSTETSKNLLTENKYYEGGNIAADIGSMARDALTGGDITSSAASMGAKVLSGVSNTMGFGEGPFAGIGGELGNIATAAMTGGDILSASSGLIEKGVTGGLSVFGDSAKNLSGDSLKTGSMLENAAISDKQTELSTAQTPAAVPEMATGTNTASNAPSGGQNSLADVDLTIRNPESSIRELTKSLLSFSFG